MVDVISDTSFLIHFATHRIKNIDSIETDIGPLSFIVPKIVKKESRKKTSEFITFLVIETKSSFRYSVIFSLF